MFPCRWLCSSLLSSNHLLENQRPQTSVLLSDDLYHCQNVLVLCKGDLSLSLTSPGVVPGMVLVPKEPPVPIYTMCGPFLAPQHNILHLCLDLCNLTMTKLPDSSCMADLSEFFSTYVLSRLRVHFIAKPVRGRSCGYIGKSDEDTFAECIALTLVVLVTHPSTAFLGHITYNLTFVICMYHFLSYVVCFVEEIACFFIPVLYGVQSIEV